MAKITQLTVTAHSRPGVLAKVARTLADAGVNITALCASEAAGRGKLRMVVSDLGRARQALAPLLIPQGSVAVDGVSLTVARLKARDFEIMIIPHTLTATTLGGLRKGQRVNLEMDMIGKYVQRVLQSRAGRGEPQASRADMKEGLGQGSRRRRRGGRT